MRHVREQMGSYAECWLSDLLVTSTKNDVDPGLMRLFRQSDKRIVPLSSADAPVQLKRRFEGVNDDIDLDDFAEEPELVYYIAPVSVVKDRLNVLGYTIETARQAFVEGLNGERAQTDRWLRAREDAEPSETRDSLLGIYRAEKKILSQLSADVWLATLKEILTEGVDIPGDDSTSRVRMAEMPVLNWYDGPLKGTLLGYMLSREWFGFPGPDTTAALRLTLEVYPEAEDLIYDVTDLVWTESAARDDDFVAYTAEVSIEEMQSMAKTILLTEGPSDASILESSLELLYPHLADYYSFMEFDAMRVGGGAGNLANLVKAFAGAGVVNKTIALFDNDTAALSALRGLANLDLPEHLAVLTLPVLKSLMAYPTIGPSGETDMDVNGRAASTELYLGEDVLCDDEGLCRVQWTGYDTALRQYQGQVLDKAGIQSRFQEKLRAARVDGEALDGAEWSGLRAIFACVFAAFHDLDRQRILEDTQAYFAEE
jgi:hypothetical protein